MKKRGDTRIEHKRDVKHNSKLEKLFIKYKIWKKEINKGIAKHGNISKRRVFLMFEEGWKKHKTGDAKRTKNQKKKKKHLEPEGRKTEQEKHVFKKRKTREKRKTQRKNEIGKRKKREAFFFFSKQEDQNKAKRKTKTRGDQQDYSKEERRNKEEQREIKRSVSKGSAKKILFRQKTNTKTE